MLGCLAAVGFQASVCWFRAVNENDRGAMEKKFSLKDVIAITEEKEENLLGMEYEPEEEEEEEVREARLPYREEDIRIGQKMVSALQLCRWIDEGELDLYPEYQRNLVWDLQRKSLLIESLLLRIPIPAFYLDEGWDGQKNLIDGLQRLSAVYDYVHGNFRLRGLQYLDACESRCFQELDKRYQRRIENTSFVVYILDSRCPDMVKFDVFKRINTGGVALNFQEIRNAMANSHTRKLLQCMSNGKPFLQATRGKVSDVRMGAQELCLRFIALDRLYKPERGFVDYLELNRLLDSTVLWLNGRTEEDGARWLQYFEGCMDKCYALFGEYAFSKPQSRHLINRALFTSWSIALGRVSASLEELGDKSSLALACMERYLEERAYYNAITSSTGSRRNLEIQMEVAGRILEEIHVS